MARPLVALLLLVTLAVSACADRAVTLDGRWWRDDHADTPKTKVLYVVGLLDGATALGPGIAGADNLGRRTLYLRSMAGYVGKITVGQVADGLFDFYDDPRNRSILVSMAAWVVIKRLSGAPRDETEAITVTLRATAVTSGMP